MSIARDPMESKKNIEWMLKDTEMYKYGGYMLDLKEEAALRNIERSIVRTPSTALKALEAYVNAGMTHADLWFVHPRFENLNSQMRLFAEQVMPSFS